MPTYEYQCANGHTFEQFQRISDKPRGKCPTCGAKASRVISGGAGLIFKGSGFYITDYGKDGKGPRKANEGSEPAAPAKADAASDSKPAEAPAKKDSPDAKEAKPEKKPKKGSS
jgi:putative FmdB family regulatory protein